MNIVTHVYKKEVRDMFRDKRVRSSAIFGPIFVMFLMVGLIGFITKQVSKKDNLRVHVVKSDSPAFLPLKQGAFQVIEVATEAEGEKLVKSGAARVVLNAHPASATGQTVIDAYIDPKEQMSQITLGALDKIYSGINQQALKLALKTKGLPSDSDEAIKLVEKDVQVGQGNGPGEFLLGMLPYLVVIWAFYGGMSIASDLVAGEKEKNTLETLLISPAARTQIVLGKFFALATVCLLSSMMSIIGLAVIATIKPPGTEVLFKNGFGVTPVAFLVILAALLPLVCFFAGLLIALSSYARNPREAQTYLSQFSFIVIIPAISSQFIGLTDAGRSLWINFVPILNSANCIRMALMGKSDPVSVAITVVVSLMLALLAVRLTVFFFNREQVLARI